MDGALKSLVCSPLLLPNNFSMLFVREIKLCTKKKKKKAEGAAVGAFVRKGKVVNDGQDGKNPLHSYLVPFNL